VANFYGRYYRIRVWGRRYIWVRDMVSLFLFGTTGYLTYIGALHSDPARALAIRVAGVVYGILFVFLVVQILNNRQARDHVQAEVVWGFLHHMNDVVFANSNLTRFTLFQPSPLRRDYLVPWYRYKFGGMEAIKEAQTSRARFRRGQGLAGRAWEQPNGELMFMSFPAFGTRTAFDTYHRDTLGMEKFAAEDLSVHMDKVRSVFAFGMVDCRGKFLGVLCLDILAPLEKKSDDSLGFDSIAVSNESLVKTLKSLQNVLESFSIKRRNDD